MDEFVILPPWPSLGPSRKIQFEAFMLYIHNTLHNFQRGKVEAKTKTNMEKILTKY